MKKLGKFGLLVSIFAALSAPPNNSYAQEKQVKEELAELVSNIYQCQVTGEQRGYVSVAEYKKGQEQDYVIYCFDIDCLEEGYELDGESVCDREIYDLKVLIDTRNLKDVKVEKDFHFGAELRLIYRDDLDQNSIEFGRYYSQYGLPFESAKKLEKLLKQYIRLEER